MSRVIEDSPNPHQGVSRPRFGVLVEEATRRFGHPLVCCCLAGWKIHEGGIEMFRTDTVAIDPYTDFSSWEGWL
jgi:hypothetical protein